MQLAIPAPRLVKGTLLAAGVLAASLIGWQALSGRAGDRSGDVTTPVALDTGGLRGGNEVLLLRDGAQAEQALLGAIADARDHIHLDTFGFDDDAAGERLARALMARQARGVSVHVLHDAHGSRDTPAAFFDRLSAAGVQVHATQASEGEARRHHRLLIVDGHTAFVGAIAEGRAQGAHAGSARDNDLRLRGPVVADLQRVFLAGWADHAGPPLPRHLHFPTLAVAGDQLVRAVAGHPDDDPPAAHALLLSAIGSARRSVHVGNARFMADEALLDALEAAARRGVAVHLVLPGHGDSWLRLQAGRGHYARLLRAGVHLHERRGTIVHARTVLVDGAWAMLGSSSLDWDATSGHHELHTVVEGRGFGASLLAMFEGDIATSAEIDPVAWRERTTDQRLREAFGQAWTWWN